MGRCSQASSLRNSWSIINTMHFCHMTGWTCTMQSNEPGRNHQISKQMLIPLQCLQFCHDTGKILRVSQNLPNVKLHTIILRLERKNNSLFFFFLLFSMSRNNPCRNQEEILYFRHSMKASHPSKTRFILAIYHVFCSSNFCIRFCNTHFEYRSLNDFPASKSTKHYSAFLILLLLYRPPLQRPIEIGKIRVIFRYCFLFDDFI